PRSARVADRPGAWAEDHSPPPRLRHIHQGARKGSLSHRSLCPPQVRGTPATACGVTIPSSPYRIPSSPYRHRIFMGAVRDLCTLIDDADRENTDDESPR